MTTRPEQALGEVASIALDEIDGRPVLAAAVVVAIDNGEDGEDGTEIQMHTPVTQPVFVTVGLVETARRLAGDA